MQAIWFKRDLRIFSHEPLRQALAAVETHGPLVFLYVHEPSWLAAVDTSAQHVAFARESLDSLHRALAQRGARLLELTMEAPDALDTLHRVQPLTHLWSHQETTGMLQFQRDRAVAQWARRNQVPWTEVPQNGVRRGSARKREPFDFAGHVRACLERPSFVPPASLPCASPLISALFEEACQRPLPPHPGKDKPLRQRGGREAAMEAMEAFFQPEQLLAYRSRISSPLTAERGCSRLSPYLSHGVLSDQEVMLRLRDVLQASEDTPLLNDAAQFFMERLYWRSAYLQSFEAQVESESVDDLTAFKGVREAEVIPAWLDAWKDGRTGFPMVDAGMRMLAQTGWLNMRLRGTVTSFAVNDLWLPWTEVGLHLAREFLDYEPGIHWNQLQIHAGTSRLSGPLTYNATKQAQDHDPRGEFIRRWVPELAQVPLPFVQEPWKLPAAQRAGAYPDPLVSLVAAQEAARERVLALREGKAVPNRAFWKHRETLLRQQKQAQLF